MGGGGGVVRLLSCGSTEEQIDVRQIDAPGETAVSATSMFPVLTKAACTSVLRFSW